MRLILLPAGLMAITLSATTAQAQTCADRYQTAADGTVFDLKTGLMWKRCAEGQTWESNTCTGPSNTNLTWQEALATAKNSAFADKTDWRLPSQKELLSLLEQQCDSPPINPTAFPNASGDWFWSSSPDARSSYHALIVNFGTGLVSSVSDSNRFAVRLVRTGR